MPAGKRSAPRKVVAVPVLTCEDKRAWHAWLEAHHADSAAVWLLIPKGKPARLTYAEALDVALAWGWIDSQKQTHDDSAWLQRFSRRGARSPWSKINRDKASALIETGAMHAPGLAEVTRAQRDGRWAAAYDSSRTARVPADLEQALAQQPLAAAFFAELDATNRYAILYRVQTAKRSETRAKRIATFVAMLARQQTLYPVRSPRAKLSRTRPSGPARR